MPCMCGDFCCPSCGPAQGNSKCILCGKWASDGCEHFDEDSGDYKPEFRGAVDAALKAENEMWEKLNRELEEEYKLADEYWKGEKK